MTQLDPNQYRRLTQPMIYGQDDGLFWDKTNSKLVLAIADVGVFNIDANGKILAGALEAPDLEIAGQARGDLIIRAAAAWARLALGSAGNNLGVNAAGTDPEWQNGGLSASVNLTADNIVGTDAGDLGHADGVELVPAVAGKVILPVACTINYTYLTAAYTDGGNLTAGYKDGGAITGLVAAAASLGAGASNVNLLAAIAGAALVNKALVLRSSAGFTQPGTAAGSAVVRTIYRLLSVG